MNRSDGSSTKSSKETGSCSVAGASLRYRRGMEPFTKTAMADLKINAVQDRTRHLLHHLQLCTRLLKRTFEVYRRQQHNRRLPTRQSSDVQHRDIISSIDITEGEFTARRSLLTIPRMVELNDKDPKSRLLSMRDIVRQTLVKDCVITKRRGCLVQLTVLRTIYIGQTESRRSIEKFGKYRF